MLQLMIYNVYSLDYIDAYNILICNIVIYYKSINSLGIYVIVMITLYLITQIN